MLKLDISCYLSDVSSVEVRVLPRRRLPGRWDGVEPPPLQHGAQAAAASQELLPGDPLLLGQGANASLLGRVVASVLKGGE